jgi:hypothetical protein
MIANDLACLLPAVLNPSGSWNVHGPGVTSTAGGGPQLGRDHDRGGISRIAHLRFGGWGGLAGVPSGLTGRGYRGLGRLGVGGQGGG